jgi:uncharacterized membrane protein YgcG
LYYFVCFQIKMFVDNAKNVTSLLLFHVLIMFFTHLTSYRFRHIYIFSIFITSQMYREGFKQALFESPGSYCAYACMYLTSCLIKLFTLATKTYEEQHRHVAELQTLSIASYLRDSQNSVSGGGGGGGGGGGASNNNRGDQTPLSGASQVRCCLCFQYVYIFS